MRLFDHVFHNVVVVKTSTQLSTLTPLVCEILEVDHNDRSLWTPAEQRAYRCFVDWFARTSEQPYAVINMNTGRSVLFLTKKRKGRRPSAGRNSLSREV